MRALYVDKQRKITLAVSKTKAGNKDGKSLKLGASNLIEII